MRVIFSKEAQKQLSKLSPNEKRKITKKIRDLSSHPSFGKLLKGQLTGLRVARAWPYRIIYIVGEEEVSIVSILHRQGAYK